MPSGSRKQQGELKTVTSKADWPTNWQGEKPEPTVPKLRGKLRRPRDPRKVRKIAVRPPRRNPLIGRTAPIKRERRLVYEPIEYEFQEEEEDGKQIK